jgi:hypothetical protein
VVVSLLSSVLGLVLAPELVQVSGLLSFAAVLEQQTGQLKESLPVARLEMRSQQAQLRDGAHEQLIVPVLARVLERVLVSLLSPVLALVPARGLIQFSVPLSFSWVPAQRTNQAK